jgi:hypothetical protein
VKIKDFPFLDLEGVNLGSWSTKTIFTIPSFVMLSYLTKACLYHLFRIFDPDPFCFSRSWLYVDKYVTGFHTDFINDFSVIILMNTPLYTFLGFCKGTLFCALTKAKKKN